MRACRRSSANRSWSPDRLRRAPRRVWQKARSSAERWQWSAWSVIQRTAIHWDAMSGQSFWEWLVTSPWANAMNGPEWAFPVVESIHFIGFALSIGTIAIVDLRLLGLGMRRQSAAQLAADLAPWTRAGLAVMLITGPLMFSADAVRYYVNES